MKKLLTILLVLCPITGLTQTQTTWDVALWGERRAFTEHVEKLAELVEQKTNGGFILNLSYDGLSSPRDNLDGIAARAFDMAQTCAGFHADKTPSLTVLELPYLGVSTLAEDRIISQDLLRRPEVARELGKYTAVALMPTPLPQQNLVGTGASPKTHNDLAGRRIRATAVTAQAMEALGAFPTLIAATDVRDALETGQIDAAAFAPHNHMTYGTIANATWWTENLNPGTVNCPVVANINSVNSLAPQHREALYSSINEALDYYVQHYEYNLSQSWEPVLRELNIEKVTLNETELEAFRNKTAATAARKWVKEIAAQGIDAQSLYESVIVAVYGEDLQDIPQDLPVFTEKKKKQQILESYAFNKVPENIAKPEQQTEPAQQPEPEQPSELAQQPEPPRTFSFDKKQDDQQEKLLPVATPAPVESRKPRIRIENISDVTVAALPASASGPMFYSDSNNQPSARAVPSEEVQEATAITNRTPQPATKPKPASDLNLESSQILVQVKTGDTVFGILNDYQLNQTDITKLVNMPLVIKHLTILEPGDEIELNIDNNRRITGLTRQLDPRTTLYVTRAADNEFETVLAPDAPDTRAANVSEVLAGSNVNSSTQVVTREKLPAEPTINPQSQNTNTYFGPPRDGTANNLTANPLDVAVEWDLDINATVGDTLQQLAQYIGYEVVDNSVTSDVLGRRLPAAQRKVKSISVADGFKVVSGEGLLTVFNHVDRTVRHLQKKAATSNENLPISVCPPDVTLASIAREGVLKLSDGSECLFQ